MPSYRKIYWTKHSQLKMREYNLSRQKLLSILHNPERRERGIVPGTIAVMKSQRRKSSFLFKNKRKKGGEIWLMYQDTKYLRKIISAWRYPGISKPGEEIPLPDDIRQALLEGRIE